MTLNNGLGVRNDLDSRMREYIENLRFLSSEISDKNKELQSTQETLDELRLKELVPSELEESFSKAIQTTLDEINALEEKRETISDTATQELNEAKESYDKAVNEIGTLGGSQAAEILSSIRERVTEIGEWEKEIQEAIDDDNYGPTLGTKRLVLRR